MEARLAEMELLAKKRAEGAGQGAGQSSVIPEAPFGLVTSPNQSIGAQSPTPNTNSAQAGSKSDGSEKRKKKTRGKSTARRQKRKIDEEAVEFDDSVHWGGDWGIPQNLFEKGKTIGHLIEDQSDAEWENEVKKMEVWQQRSDSLTGVVAYLRSRLNALKEVVVEKNATIQSLESAKVEAATTINSLGEENTTLKKSNDNLKKQKTGLSNQVKELTTAAKNLEEEKKNLLADVAKFQNLFLQEAEGTYENVMNQVRFFNPSARLANVHYRHILQGDVLMKVNVETKQLEAVELVAEEDPVTDAAIDQQPPLTIQTT